MDKKQQTVPVNNFLPPSAKSPTVFTEFMKKMGVNSISETIDGDVSEVVDNSQIEPDIPSPDSGHPKVEIKNIKEPIQTSASVQTDKRKGTTNQKRKLVLNSQSVMETVNEHTDDAVENDYTDLEDYINLYFMVNSRHSKELKRLYIPKDIHAVLLILLNYSELEGIETNLQKILNNILKQHITKHAQLIRMMKRRIQRAQDTLDL